MMAQEPVCGAIINAFMKIIDDAVDSIGAGSSYRV